MFMMDVTSQEERDRDARVDAFAQEVFAQLSFQDEVTLSNGSVSFAGTVFFDFMEQHLELSVAEVQALVAAELDDFFAAGAE